MDPTDPIAHLQALIRCPSVTPAEGGALTYLEEVLTPLGFEVHRPIFSAEGTPDVENLFARLGTDAPCLLFAGHTDVVPVGEEASWAHPPFSGTVADGEVWGRGAVDMKGGVAAFVAACAELLRDGPPHGSIAFAITGDEEGPAVNGTAKLMEWAHARGHRFDACILGEPTNASEMGEAIKVGRRGSASGVLTVTGIQGHAAYPHLADNPVPRTVRLLAALDALVLDEGTERFQPSNLEIVSVDVGNPAFNVIPARATARFNVRFNDVHDLAGLEATIRTALDGTGERYDLAMQPGGSEAFLADAPDFVDLVRQEVARVTGREPELSTAGGTSDARFIKDYCPVLEFGGVGSTMHQVDERARIADVVMLRDVYAAILRDMLRGERPDGAPRD